MYWKQLWDIMSAPDNVPISSISFLIPFYSWLAYRQARANDRLIAQLGADPQLAKTHHRKTWPWKPGWLKEVHTWPYLMRIEFLAALIVTVILTVWSITLNAPLEELSNPNLTMNPAKAPWYFLGLQEMLVYFDPWMAGVVFPTLIIVGLMVIPYIDTNPKGNGYFTFKERKVEITIFLVGFLVLWCILIVLGTFLRGPNWNFFGPYEFWDINKLVPLNNINLSEIIWIKMFKTGMPRFWLFREIFGLGLVVLYMGLLPPILAETVLRRFYEKMGTVRYLIGVNLALIMLALPIKMYLRWIFNLKYIVNIPEASF